MNEDAVEEMTSYINRAAQTQRLDVFLKMMDYYIADDAEIQVSSRVSIIGLDNQVIEKKLSKDEYLQDINTNIGKMREYNYRLHLTSSDVDDTAQTARFMTRTEEKGMLLYNAQSHYIKVDFTANYVCQNEAKMINGQIKITKMVCRGSSRMSPKGASLEGQ